MRPPPIEHRRHGVLRLIIRQSAAVCANTCLAAFFMRGRTLPCHVPMLVGRKGTQLWSSYLKWTGSFSRSDAPDAEEFDHDGIGVADAHCNSRSSARPGAAAQFSPRRAWPSLFRSAALKSFFRHCDIFVLRQSRILVGIGCEKSVLAETPFRLFVIERRVPVLVEPVERRRCRRLPSPRDRGCRPCRGRI